MAEIWNVIGKRDQVESMLALCPCKMTDKFPTDDEDTLDINVSVEDEDCDELVEFCEDNGLECELV